MENSKGVTRFFVGTIVFILLLGLGYSLYLDVLPAFVSVLAVVGFILLGLALLALVLAVEFGPLVWLLSRLSKRRSKRKE